VDTLSNHLAVRVNPLNGNAVRAEGDFVLVWLHHAVRDHDNPALDAAIELANRIGKPALVYQGLGGAHRFNSDRHHVFILEGARDVARGLARRGLSYAFWLPEDPDTPSPLRGLAARACCVVTEDFPAPPFPQWARAHAKRCASAMLAVDSSCLMPMRTLGKPIDRAFKFRDKAKAHWQGPLREPWVDVESEQSPFDLKVADVGFEPVDFESLDIVEAAARCHVDHSIAPAPHLRGGSVSGYERWEVFKRDGLRAYDRRRNNAADLEGVSGLSPYLHHGQVSPFRIAREAYEIGGKGAEKFLDELLVWREMSYSFCAHTDPDRLEKLGVLPAWAQETLRDHERDDRQRLTWERLSRAKTGDELWDAAQSSLIRNGELHNNLRMTWGKMVPRWVRTTDEALRMLIDLNHRFALDGNNPNSYGGLLWCLGGFDRPFQPEAEVLGTVRSRTTDIHAERLDPACFRSAVRRRSGVKDIVVHVLGAGFGGLACARMLTDYGADVAVVETGQRDVEHPFDVTDPRFGRFVRSWIDEGICERDEASGGVTPRGTRLFDHFRKDLRVVSQRERLGAPDVLVVAGESEIIDEQTTRLRFQIPAQTGRLWAEREFLEGVAVAGRVLACRKRIEAISEPSLFGGANE